MSFRNQLYRQAQVDLFDCPKKTWASYFLVCLLEFRSSDSWADLFHCHFLWALLCLLEVYVVAVGSGWYDGDILSSWVDTWQCNYPLTVVGEFCMDQTNLFQVCQRADQVSSRGLRFQSRALDNHYDLSDIASGIFELGSWAELGEEVSYTHSMILWTVEHYLPPDLWVWMEREIVVHIQLRYYWGCQDFLLVNCWCSIVLMARTETMSDLSRVELLVSGEVLCEYVLIFHLIYFDMPLLSCVWFRIGRVSSLLEDQIRDRCRRCSFH